MNPKITHIPIGPYGTPAERAESEAALKRINYRIFKSSNPDGTKSDFEAIWPEMKRSFFGDPPEHEA